MDELERRAELKQFLRAKRAGIKPDAICDTVPRRTRGLRRSELAKRAKVSLTWYSWLEMGRDIRLSKKALTGVAQALELSIDETAYLFSLAGTFEAVSEREPELLSIAARAVDGFTRGPAFIANGRWDLLFVNRLARAVYGFDPTASGYGNNLLWIAYLDPKLRHVHKDPDRMADNVAAIFRMRFAHEKTDASYQGLVADLCAASPRFRAFWKKQSVLSFRHTEAVIDHAQAGRLVFDYVNLNFPENDDLRMVLHLPRTGTGTEDRLLSLSNPNAPEQKTRKNL